MGYNIGLVCDIGAGPDQGGRKSNEDNFLVCQSGHIYHRSEEGKLHDQEQHGEGVLLAVCDGMGGHESGDVASTVAVQVLAKLYQPGPSPRHPAKVLLNYILDSHQRLHQAARFEGPVSMGTTLTAAWLLHGTVAWAQVGDSRLYLLRRGQISQLTRDQTRNEFARRDGRQPTPDGDHLAQSFIYGSRGLGDDHTLRLEHGLDTGAEMLHQGDRLLLCTDGLTRVTDAPRICAILGSHDGPQEAAEALHRHAIQLGSLDNITAMVVRVDEVHADPDQLYR